MITTEQLQCFTLQFITHHNSETSYYSAAVKALDGGCRWIQLRMKNATADELLAVATRLKPLCREAGAVFIIDDNVDVCKRVEADGVHLGKNDMPPAEARRILGERAIIGATCNTYEQICRVADAADYIGCGPFRFTSTKEKLAPVLGLDGYRDIVWQCRANGINIPIVAIGGILLADVPDILDAGPNGIAVSGAILNADDPSAATNEFLNTIRNHNII